MPTERPVLEHVLKRRADFFEHAVHHAPSDLRNLLLHDYYAPQIQAVILGIKPASELSDKETKPIAEYLDKLALETGHESRFVHGHKVIGNAGAIQEVVRRNPHAFSQNGEVRTARDEKRLPDPGRVIAFAGHGHVQYGLLMGYSRKSVEAYAKLTSKDPSKTTRFLLEKRIQKNPEDRHIVEEFRKMTIQDLLDRPNEFRQARGKAARVIRRYAYLLIQEPNAEETEKLNAFLNGRELDGETFYQEYAKPEWLQQVPPGDPYMWAGYCVSPDDSKARGLLQLNRSILTVTDFNERLRKLKQQYPA